MKRTNALDFDDVLALPSYFRGIADDSVIDVNQHVNVLHFYSWHSLNMIGLLGRDIGIDDEYRSEMRESLVSLEQHIQYFGEVRLSDEFSVHTRVLGRSERVVHMMSFLANVSQRRVANSVEHMTVYMSLDSRSALPMPREIYGRFDHHIAASLSMNWDPPRCGSIRLPGGG